MEQTVFYESVMAACKAAGMKMPTDPAVRPDDYDWHQVVVKAQKTKQHPEVRYKLATALFTPPFFVGTDFYSGQFWTLGTSIPSKEVEICAYDAVPKMKNTRDAEIKNMEGALRLTEAILRGWYADYKQALKDLKRERSEDNISTVNFLENTLPIELLPGSVTKKEILKTIRAEVGV